MKTRTYFLIMGLWIFVSSGCSEGQNADGLPIEEVSESEILSLKWMREEEMLAHDVYLTLSEQYSIPVFANITRSEMRHTTAVAGLLEKYGIEDPAADHKTGVFTYPEMQTLYDELILQGLSSYEEAILVGLQIEDLDIADLEKALADAVDKEDIILVYSNLLRGSKNHMNAFWFHASRNSIPWEPVHISQEKFEEITGSGNP
jgi:hypothetical protein